MISKVLSFRNPTTLLCLALYPNSRNHKWPGATTKSKYILWRKQTFVLFPDTPESREQLRHVAIVSWFRRTLGLPVHWSSILVNSALVNMKFWCMVGNNMSKSKLQVNYLADMVKFNIYCWSDFNFSISFSNYCFNKMKSVGKPLTGSMLLSLFDFIFRFYVF